MPIVLKGMFAQLLGELGKNSEFLFFPGKNKDGQPIADAKRKGSFAIVLDEKIAGEENLYEWKLPFTSVSPPKFCPIGKEKVEAQWTYCPWHGNRLDQSQ